jgi:hypothetical protein
MISDAVLSAWPLDRLAMDLRLLVAAAQEGKAGQGAAPAQVPRGPGDSIAVQVVKGKVPAEPGALLYILGRGTFRVVRCERWPGGGELLLLEAWPRR